MFLDAVNNEQCEVVDLVMESGCRGVDETMQVAMQVKQEFAEKDSQQEGHQRWEQSMDYIDMVDPDCIAEMVYTAFREEAFFFSDE